MKARRATWSAAALLIGAALALPMQSQAQEDEGPSTLEELLELVRQGKIREDAEAARREQAFQQRRQQQAELLRRLKTELDQERGRSAELEEVRNENNLQIARLREQKEQVEGSLKEIFGNLQASATELATYMETSLVTAQLGTGRIQYLRDLARRMENTDRLPQVSEIERLWFEMQREMYESGRIVQFDTLVVGTDGQTRKCSAYRISLYSVICDGNYVVLQKAGHLSELPAQPAPRFRAAADDFEGEQHEAFGVDPTGPLGNNLLKNLISSPTLGERIDHGGIIGRLILTLGAIGIAIAVAKFVLLILVGLKVRAQLATETPSPDNPLGRVMQVYEDNQSASLDELEAKLAQSITQERPRIESFVPLLKIIATVAPLMGLLGTVTGMIITFQQITIYGTGDPKTMAGGISVALVTTVLGLVVAIPMVLLHAIVSSRVRSILQILEGRSMGLIARSAEAGQR